MAKQGSRAEVNTFIQGLITEASPLNFPPNASKREENFELFRDGTRKRRLGLDLEANYLPLSSGIVNVAAINDRARSVFKWTSVAGDTSKDFLVVQLNGVFSFYDLSVPGSLGNSFLGSWAGFGDFADNKCSFASVDGKLVITFGQMVIGVLTYNFGTGSFSQTTMPLMVRDFWGVEVAAPDEEYEYDRFYQGAESNATMYNLRNQSWAQPRKGAAGTYEDPLTIFINEYTKCPSNSESVWAALQYQPVTAGADPFERIYKGLWKETKGADLSAARGHFIIDGLNRGQSRQTAYATNNSQAAPTVMRYPSVALPIDSSYEGIKLVCEFAGRAWYSGFGGQVGAGDKRSPNLSNYVFFSQLVRSPGDINKCYQDGDPTSREGADLVDTDGGYIRISGAKKITSLQNMTTHLLVFADNGVWAISGGGDYGFTATNYKVNKISSFGSIADTSIVNYGGILVYWGGDAIYKVAPDKSGQLVADSMTQTTIQQYYDSISLTAKMGTQGIYDELRKRMVWSFREGGFFNDASVVNELIFDVTLNCFYINRIVRIPGNNSVEPLMPLFRDNEVYYVVLGNPEGSIEPGKFMFAHYRDESFRDWKTFNGIGVDAKAFLETGAAIAGDSAIMKQTPYLVMHFRKTETETDEEGVPLNQSSCLYRTQWDWATSSSSHKFGSLAQAYKYRKPYYASLPDTSYDNGFETVVSKNKVRGRGRAVALYLETEPDKDCNILGWNLTINGNALA